MGTLFNQPERKNLSILDSDVKIQIDVLKSIRGEYGISFNESINVLMLLELRRKNDLSVINGDIFDEQMQGIGELLQK